MIEQLAGDLWIYFGILILVLGGLIVLILTYFGGIDIKGYAERFFKSEETETEEIPNFKIIYTDNVSPPTIIDPYTNENESIYAVVLRGDGEAALLSKNSDNKLAPYSHIRNRPELQPEDPIALFVTTPGSRWIINKNSVVNKLKNEVNSLSVQLEISSEEKKKLNTIVEEKMIERGESYKELKKAAFGRTNIENRDRWGRDYRNPLDSSDDDNDGDKI